MFNSFLFFLGAIGFLTFLAAAAAYLYYSRFGTVKPLTALQRRAAEQLSSIRARDWQRSEYFRLLTLTDPVFQEFTLEEQVRIIHAKIREMDHYVS